ncbi:MAG: imidazole glycerol phosphate synthase subunit HisF, partial [Candidatus Heimdallarchaeota archaeon]
MITKRIIPCLDVKNGQVVKGIKFQGLREVGDPVAMAKEYDTQCADELVFLDITATNDKRSTVVNLVEKVAEQLSIPFTIGGGVWNTEDIRILLQSGADKVVINTAAMMKPDLISEAAEAFGSQCVVVAIDAKRNNDSFEVVINAGKKLTGIDVIDWVKMVQKLGAG